MKTLAQLPMRQTAVDIATLSESHKDIEGEALMSIMMAFERELIDASAVIRDQMKADRDPKAMLAAINRTISRALRLGALDLVEVSRMALNSIAQDDIDAATRLGASASADAMLWLSVAGTTRTAMAVLFQASMLNGRAPNGKPIRT